MEYCSDNFILGYDISAKIEEEIRSQLDHEIRAILYDESKKLCETFFDFVQRTIKRLKERVTAPELSTFVLTRLGCFAVEYSDTFSTELKKCNEVDDVLRVLLRKGCDVITFDNIDVLESIVQEYLGNVDEDLGNYKKELDFYLRRRICEHHLFQPDAVGTEVTSVSEKAQLYIFMDEFWTKDTSFRKLRNLEKWLATSLRCRHIQLKAITLGSLRFCFNILGENPTFNELHIMQVLDLIHFGVEVLSEEINGCLNLQKMDETCE